MGARPPDSDALNLQELACMAYAFDGISDEEGGARYPAARFVEFVRAEVMAVRFEPGHRPRAKREELLRRAAGE